jgi:hypothetical protein
VSDEDESTLCSFHYELEKGLERFERAKENGDLAGWPPRTLHPTQGLPGDPGVVSRGGAEPVPGTGNVVPTLLRAWKEEIPAGAVERGERAKRRRRGGVERGGERAPREQFAVNERNLSFFWTTGSCNFARH